ncbi:MAG: DUF1592 domain-containing protein [Bdellovibrionales bacterium]|nr:DUF1592 domain-containing protein [Bdellovibrionales bacterium]
MLKFINKIGVVTIILTPIILSYQSCAPIGNVVESASSGESVPTPLNQGDKLSFNSDFGKEAKNILVKRCAACHGVQEGGFGGISDILNPDSLIRNSLVVPKDPASSRLYQSIQTGRMPKDLQMPDSEKEKIYYWIAGLEDKKGNCLPKEMEAKANPETRMWRLTRRQILNTLNATFAIQLDKISDLPKDVRNSGFENSAEAMHIESTYTQNIQRAADSTAKLIVNDLALRAALNFNAADKVTNFIKNKGLKLFRRPISNEEINDFLVIYRMGDTGQEGVELVLQAMLQSPYLWYHQELRNNHPYYLYFLASRLSFAATNTIPDDALFAAAASGDLANNSEFELQVNRYLAKPQANDQLTKFVTEWFNVGAIEGQRFAEGVTDNGNLSSFMTEEARLFVKNVIENKNANLHDLFITKTTYINKDLAQFYGINPSSINTTFAPFQMDGINRSGIMTLPAVIASVSADTNTYIHRGKFVRQQLMCQDFPPPPPIPDSQQEAAEVATTDREKSAQRAKLSSCKTCHAMMDPIGFSYSNFSQHGLFSPFSTGKHLDDSTKLELTVNADGQYKGAAELSRGLASSTDVQECSSQRMFEFLFGRSPSEPDRCEISKINEQYKNSNYNMKALFEAYLKSDLLMKRGP